MKFEALTDGNGHTNGWPCRMLVFGQSEARRFAPQLEPTHVLSIKSAQTRYFGPTGIAEDRHLMVVIEDTIDPDQEGRATAEDIAGISAWVATLPADARLLVHGLQGMHRCCAVALGILASQVPPYKAGALLHSIRPQANPNRLMVRLLDEHLDLNGELVRTGRNFPCDVWRERDANARQPAREAARAAPKLRSKAS